MKRSIGIFMVLIMWGITGNAQTNLQGEMNNYVVSTTQIPQLQPIILTAEALKEEDGAKFGDFQIVMYGPNVNELTSKEEMETYTAKAKAAGVAIFVCKISIGRLGIEPGELHEYIQVVDHAYTHLLQLEKDKNYYSLQL
ncbi:sulfur reduction protein DsrE [Antarcticibacterium flavum]|uniref:Sulfur reduction protein DsrE n=1 Tax=Antarcticibacterium flavum TaxID=2058175 RepID=A0A5B7WZJ4_9FLAO|nr:MULTISPECIES: sulfur reduction protein DsrE [Antarcticibacterium]QCY68490.1 sulfur reduction protein DsrE [Antarcticibacterium flavum]